MLGAVRTMMMIPISVCGCVCVCAICGTYIGKEAKESPRPVRQGHGRLLAVRNALGFVFRLQPGCGEGVRA